MKSQMTTAGYNAAGNLRTFARAYTRHKDRNDFIAHATAWIAGRYIIRCTSDPIQAPIRRGATGGTIRVSIHRQRSCSIWRRVMKAAPSAVRGSVDLRGCMDDGRDVSARDKREARRNETRTGSRGGGGGMAALSEPISTSW